MTILGWICAGMLFAVVCWITFRVTGFVSELGAAVSSKRQLLLSHSSLLLKWLGFEALVTQTNQLIERYSEFEEANTERLNQLEATLGSIQEAVIIFSDNRIIEYANQSARKLFRHGTSLKGLRLESALRSPNLIEYLNRYFKDHSHQLQPISLERQEDVLWFEASCVEVRNISELNEVATLLVLHDITRLKSLETIRREFVANVSHELRTPITIIKGYTETLLEDNEALSAVMRTRFLNTIARNTQRLHLLVEDLLILSRLESSPDEIRLVLESLQDLAHEVMENYQMRLNAETQKIVLECDEQIGMFAFDRFRIQQVFDNLIENIFSYAPEFTLIKLQISFNSTKDQVDCMVADDGPGIPKKDLPHIFERFYRVDKGRSYEKGGTGLGLSIMKHIVQQHGGSVSAQSKTGKGTAIYFSLPYLQSLSETAGDEDFNKM